MRFHERARLAVSQLLGEGILLRDGEEACKRAEEIIAFHITSSHLYKEDGYGPDKQPERDLRGCREDLREKR